MTTVTPPAPPPPPLPPAPPPLVTVQSPPSALLKMAVGAELLASVTQLPASGLMELESPLGRLLIQPVLSLPKSAVLTLVLRTLEPQPQFLVTAVNGKPVSGGANPNPVAPAPLQKGLVNPSNPTAQSSIVTPQPPQGQPGSTKSPGVGAVARQPSVRLVPGRQLSATILSRLIGATPVTAGKARAPTSLLPRQQTAPTSASNAAANSTGNLARLRSSMNALGPTLGAKQLPQPTSARTTQTSTTILRNLPLTAAQSRTAAAPSTPGTPSATAAPFSPGTRMQVRVVSVGQNAAATPSQPARVAGLTLSGVVAGRTPGGHPIIQTDKGIMSLDTRADIPQGTRVTVEVRQVRRPLRPLPITQASIHSSGPPSGAWANLEEAVVTLHENTPILAEQFVRTTLPRPAGGLAATFLLILSAVRAGNLSNLVGGPALRTLERVDPGLTKRLGDDFQQMSGTVSDPATGDWRYASLPINLGTTIQRIRLFMKQRDRKKSKQKDDQGGTRFILEFELSALGRVQFDGMSKEEQHQLDLIVRTTIPVPAPLRDGINEVFRTTLTGYGLSGQLAYQGKAKFVEIKGSETTISGLATGDLSHLLV